MNNSEIGRELKTDELQPETIVVTEGEHRRGVFMTMWVKEVSDEMVFLWAGEINLMLGLFRQPDGTLKDDGGRVIRVYEYLGSP